MAADAPAFVMFGEQHLVTMTVLLVITVFVPLVVTKLASNRVVAFVAIGLSLLLLFLKIAEPIIRASTWEELREMLPLHLCDIGAILSCIMLINRSYRLYEITYFWALGGTVQALLTPDLTYGFPHSSFLFYFVTHGLIIVNVIYATVLFKYRPTLMSIWRAFVVTAGYAILIAPINLLLNTNYLYLCHKPASASILDFLGPWPWYLLSLIPVSFIIFFIYYLPFLTTDLITKRKPTVGLES